MDEQKAAGEESFDSDESDGKDFSTPQQQHNDSQDLEWDGHEENPSFQFEEAASFLGDDQGEGDGPLLGGGVQPAPAA